MWHKRFTDNKIPVDGTIVEVAPGYEPKIGNALSLYEFKGTIFLVEPDKQAAKSIQKMYQGILSQATVKVITKPLENIIVGIDIPRQIDALIASHPFDDMVIACMAKEASFFSDEKNDGARLSADKKDFYSGIEDEDYERGVQSVIAVWKNVIRKFKPDYFIASQYPSHTLSVKGLLKRQKSGFVVLCELKNCYVESLKHQDYEPDFGYKGSPDWWIIAKKPERNIADDLHSEPAAMGRLGKEIFVPQSARALRPEEYEIVYVNKEYFKNQGYGDISKDISKLAIVLDHESSTDQESETPSSRAPILSGRSDPEGCERSAAISKDCFTALAMTPYCKTAQHHYIKTYADRQKDATDISLSGNHGSGRAVYYGANFNILGVGKTSLCKSSVPSHSTGKLELVGAMRRLILAEWISRFIKRTPEHVVLIALKETAKHKWNPNPIPLALLVRVDDGSLDRPTHVEQSPDIEFDFNKTLVEYAKLDAEYFAFRFMLGAWCAGNYSLHGHIIDLESASFVKYRGPYHTASSKYPENRFGYEGLGFIKILRQLARVKNIDDENIESDFYKERSERLAYCFLSLLGVLDNRAADFLSRHRSEVVALASELERLAKKVSTHQANLNLYFPVSDNNDSSLLDMSKLFRNLSELYGLHNASCGSFPDLIGESRFSQKIKDMDPRVKPEDDNGEGFVIRNDVEEKAFEYLLRKHALTQLSQEYAAVYSCDSQFLKKAEIFLQENALVTESGLQTFLGETKKFIHELFKLLTTLDTEKCLDEKEIWHERLQKMNQDFPPMFELNAKLCDWAEKYRLREISAAELGNRIEELANHTNV